MRLAHGVDAPRLKQILVCSSMSVASSGLPINQFVVVDVLFFLAEILVPSFIFAS